MNSLEIMKRHLGKPEEVELEDGEKVLIAPLPAEFMPEYLVTQMELQDNKGKVNKGIVETIQTCIFESLKLANPREGGMDVEAYNQLLKTFTSQNFFLLMEKVSEMNRGGLNEKQMRRIAKLKERLEKTQDAERDKGDTGEVKKD